MKCRICKVALNDNENIVRFGGPGYAHQECSSTYQKYLHSKHRDEALEKYGSRCVCCGETHKEFLAFDHIYNNGAEHRRTMNNLLPWLRRNDFPDTIQILCHNCNMAKAFYGNCPHNVL